MLEITSASAKELMWWCTFISMKMDINVNARDITWFVNTSLLSPFAVITRSIKNPDTSQSGIKNERINNSGLIVSIREMFPIMYIIGLENTISPSIIITPTNISIVNTFLTRLTE